MKLSFEAGNRETWKYYKKPSSQSTLINSREIFRNVCSGAVLSKGGYLSVNKASVIDVKYCEIKYFTVFYSKCIKTE